MGNIDNLRVYHAAIAQLRDIARITADVRFGDLANQLRRAGISVVSNLAEGAARGHTADYARFAAIARASNAEVAAQLDIVVALGGPTDIGAARAANRALGRQLSALVRYLRNATG